MSDKEPGISFYAKIIHYEIERQVNAFFKEQGLTKVQADVLHFLMREQEKGHQVKQKDIEEFFHISNPTVSGILDRLEMKDLMVRVKSDEDKRVRFTVPTQQGIETLESLKNTITQVEEDLVKDIDPALAEQGMLFLKKVMNNLIERKENCLCSKH